MMETKTDPRPDLQADSENWTRLLLNAAALASDLAGTLHGLRCLGARIIVAQDGRWRIAGGQIPAADWERHKRDLAPHAPRIEWLLQICALGQALGDEEVAGLPVPWRTEPARPAWAIINSSILGEVVAVLFDERHRERLARRGFRVVYTPEEIARHVAGRTDEEKRAYHREKVAREGLRQAALGVTA